MFNELLDATRPRQLQAAEPQTFVEGGGTLDTRGFTRDTEPSQADLDRWYNIWARGGPIGALIDQRALMTFGVGTEWTTEDDTLTVPNDRGLPETVAEWLERNWPSRQRDEWFIHAAQTAYWAGFSPWEPVRTRSGDLLPQNEPFHGLEYVSPRTIDAFWDDHGQIQEWVQRVDRGAFTDRLTAELGADDLSVITLTPRGRHPLGLSLVDRAISEIERYFTNQDAIAEALNRFGYTGFHVRVGAEGGQPIDDNELRRVKSRIKRVEGAKNLVTGRDVEIGALDSGSFGEGINAIMENDIRAVAHAIGVPLEWTNFGGDGLGTGKPAESRQTWFERQARADQRRMATHALDIARLLIEESPFPDDVHIDLQWGDVVSDQQAVADWLQLFKASYTHNEARQKLGDGPVPEDADIDGDAPVREEDAGGGMGEGGLFASGGPDTGNRHLGSDDREPWERAYDRIFEQVVWGDDTGRQLFEFDPEEVPQFAIDRLREAVLAGAVFSDFESVPSGARETLKATLLDSLEESHGWSVDSIRDNLTDAIPGLDAGRAETIARTETAALTNKAREIGYEEQGLEDARFYWQGPENDRTTDACSWLKGGSSLADGGPSFEGTNPQYGGEPVPLDRLKELVGEANSAFIDHDDREWLPHINCRHTWVRATGAV